MEKRSRFLLLSALSVALLVLAACGGAKPATVADISVFPNAVELKAGSSNIADTLSKNMATDAKLRQAVGAGGKMEQKGFALPKDTKWEDVSKFYEDKLKGQGWTSGLGGLAGNMVDVNQVMNAANEGNDLFKTEIFTKDKQSLTVVMVTDPVSKEEQLLLSLNSN